MMVTRLFCFMLTNGKGFNKKGDDLALQAVEGALQALDIPGHDMGVNLHCLHIGMAEKVLAHPDAFHKRRSAAIEKLRHQQVSALNEGKKPLDLRRQQAL